MPESGQVHVDHQLTLVKRIGSGQLGAVFAAVHEVLARRFAVKVIKAELTRDESTIRRLRHVVRDSSTVQHQNIVALTDFGQLPDGRVYLTMDFVHGLSLSSILRRDGHLEVSRAIRLLIQLADGLDAAHRLHVVHGDIKPNNIMVTENANENDSLCLYDFALVPSLGSGPSSDDPLSHLQLHGNLFYVAPEQLTGDQVDERADIYAFGVVAYEMLTGWPPHIGSQQEVVAGHCGRDPVTPSLRGEGQSLSTSLDALVLRCLAKKPRDRFATIGEVRDALRALLPEEQEQESSGRWKLAPEIEAQLQETTPESPALIRLLFDDTIFELAAHYQKEAAATAEMLGETNSLRQMREEVSALAVQCELSESRLEEVRGELREREAAIQYAIIDLNMVKTESPNIDSQQIDVQIRELKRELERLRDLQGTREAALAGELQHSQEALSSIEQRMTLHYSRLHDVLDDVHPRLKTDTARELYRRLGRCRDALARSQAGHTPIPR